MTFNDSCKCPYYCKNHGRCELCLKDENNDCSDSLKTYCNKKRVPKEKPIEEQKGKKKPVSPKKKGLQGLIWATHDEHGLNPPVLEKTLKIHDPPQRIHNSEKCKECDGIGFYYVDDCEALFGRRKERCHSCLGKKYREHDYMETYGYNFLFNESGRLIVTNDKIYDIDNNGKVITDNIKHSHNLISYSKGIIRSYGTGENYIAATDTYNSYSIIASCSEKNAKITGENVLSNTGPNIIIPSTRYGGNISRYRFDRSCIGFIIIWDFITKKALFKIPIDIRDKEYGFDYSPLGKRFAVCLEDGRFLIWHWDSNEDLSGKCADTEFFDCRFPYCDFHDVFPREYENTCTYQYSCILYKKLPKNCPSHIHCVNCKYCKASGDEYYMNDSREYDYWCKKYDKKILEMY